jgi:hypothetical protein
VSEIRYYSPNYGQHLNFSLFCKEIEPLPLTLDSLKVLIILERLGHFKEVFVFKNGCEVQCCGSGSIQIRILLALLDQDPYGSGSSNLKTDQKFEHLEYFITF